MTVICIVITRQFTLSKLTGSAEGKPYYVKVAIGYSVPFFITLLTLIAELTMSTCAWGRPKMGMESCFFAGTRSIRHALQTIKFIASERITKNYNTLIVTDEAGRFMWFYIPITLSLLVNVIGCIMIVWTIFSHEKRMKFELKDHTKRNQKMNRCAKFYSNCTRKELLKE